MRGRGAHPGPLAVKSTESLIDVAGESKLRKSIGVLEYGVSVAAIAVGWGGYLKELLDSLVGVVLPDSIAEPPGDGGVFNLPVF